MAGDWIPMRTNLEDDPTVIFISRTTKLQSDHVVGKLHRFWSWAESHTADGRLDGVDAAWIDRRVGKRGFARAMADAPHPWLEINSSGVILLHFDRWMSKSAKRRLTENIRKRLARISSDDDADNLRTPSALQQSRAEHSRVLISPALGGDVWKSVLARARKVADAIGKAGTARNQRLLLGACILALNEMGETWLENAVRETKDANPQKPYAYFQTILVRTAESSGVDFRGSIAAIDFPAKQPILISEAPSC